MFTLKDARQGQVLWLLDVTGRHWLVIYKKCVAKRLYVFAACSPERFYITLPGQAWGRVSHIIECSPVTQDQSEYFFRRMSEAGWKWDSERKELTKIKLE
jgi:hypothetical protein